MLSVITHIMFVTLPFSCHVLAIDLGKYCTATLLAIGKLE